jgi:hypothetical protein
VDETKEHVEHRIVRSCRVSAEQRADGGVEVLAIRYLAEPVDLLAVGADPRRPVRLDGAGEVGAGVDVGIRTLERDLADEVGVCGQHRSQSAVAGRLGGERERSAVEQDRIATSVVRVAGNDDRVGRVTGLLQERFDRFGADARLVAEHDERARGVLRHGSQPDRDRARQTTFGFGVAYTSLAAPLDGCLDRLRVGAEDDDDVGQPGGVDGIEHVLQHRLAADLGKQLDAAEP